MKPASLGIGQPLMEVCLSDFQSIHAIDLEYSIISSSQPCKIVILFSQKYTTCENLVFNTFQNHVLYNVYGEIISSNNTS